jgi:2-succinyl-6-hydroxy-2,4-cyclohexadiene-1-carboxylate synthase
MNSLQSPKKRHRDPIMQMNPISWISHKAQSHKTNRRARFIVASADLSARLPADKSALVTINRALRDSGRYCSEQPISPTRQQERPVYGTGNPCGCPARTPARSGNPKYFQQTTLAINDIHLGVDVYGTGNPCGCPDWQQSPISGTLVLLHGFTGSTANWKELLTHLDLPGWRIIALDMLGHGRSDAPADPQRYAIEHCQEDIIATLRELSIKPGEAILLGYSMGGRIALYSAFSGFFRAVILESASPGLASAAERARRSDSDNVLADRIERQGLAAFVAYWEQLPLFASQSALPRQTRDTLHEQRLRNRPTGLANSLRGIGTGMQPSLHDQLQDLPIPVSLIAGELDTKYCAIAHHMAATLPNSTLNIVSNAGHTVHLEQPTIFAALVHEFCMAML